MEENSLLKPYMTDVKKPIYTILQFSPRLGLLARPERRARARLYCSLCKRHHHLQWGEMQNAICKHGASSLDEIVATYSWKYCHVIVYDSFSYGDTPEKEQRLITELQSLHQDVEVLECVHRRKNIFALKLRTPLRMVLDENTVENWRDLVREDIRAAESVHSG